MYLDYNSTSPMDPRVFEAMRPFFLEEIGNGSSRTHVYGQRAKDAVEIARNQVADLLANRPQQVVFTSGATESNNTVLFGLARYGSETGRKHILTSAIEHKSVLEPLNQLARAGFEVEVLPVTSGGYVEPDIMNQRLRPDTLLVSVMHANNETGVLQPVLEIGEIVARSNAFFHVDAAQSFGKEVEALQKLRYDFVSISGHKVYGPKGIGALLVKRQAGRRCPLSPLLYGRGQEMGVRPGTLPVPLVVGLGVAADLARREHLQRSKEAASVKRHFFDSLAGINYRVNGDHKRTQAHVVNLSFYGVDAEALMMSVRSAFAISNGAVCSSAGYSASHVLKAMGISEDLIASAVRFSWGPGVKDIRAHRLAAMISKLRINLPR
jgi:cysteine desulfurase